jgi:hypothetical protein
MTVSFELDVEEFQAMNRVWLGLQPARPLWRRVRLFRAGLAVIGVMAICALLGEIGRAAGLGLLAGAVTLLLAPLLEKNDVDRATKAFVQNASFRKLLGKRTIALTQEGIRSQSEIGERLAYWSAVESVHDTPTHVFVKIPGNDVFGIPKQAFESHEQAELFVQTINHYQQNPTIITTETAIDRLDQTRSITESEYQTLHR